MSPKQINHAIHEHFGWEYVPAADGWRRNTRELHYEIPNYHCDLNAMHEAEKTFDLNEKKRFAYTLYMMPGFGGLEYGDGIYYPTLFRLMHTTAAQRAEAFLRTVGKWKDQ